MIFQKILNLEVYTLGSARRVKKRSLLPRMYSSPPPHVRWELTTDPVTGTTHLLEVMTKRQGQLVARAPSVAKFPCTRLLLSILPQQKCLLLHPKYSPLLLQLETSSTKSRKLLAQLRLTQIESLKWSGGRKVDSTSLSSRLALLFNPWVHHL